MSYVLATILTFNTWYLPFIFGMALADLYASGRLEAFKKKRWITGALAGAVLFGAYTWSAPASIYTFVNMHFFASITTNHLVPYLAIGATLLIFAVLASKRLTSWLERPKISALGKYTFSLYLVHLPVLYTTGVLTFLALYPRLGYNMAALVTFLVNVPIIALITVLFERYIDAPAVKFSNIVAIAFENGESIRVRVYALRVRRRVCKYGRLLLRKPTVIIEEASIE